MVRGLHINGHCSFLYSNILNLFVDEDVGLVREDLDNFVTLYKKMYNYFCVFLISTGFYYAHLSVK